MVCRFVDTKKPGQMLSDRAWLGLGCVRLSEHNYGVPLAFGVGPDDLSHDPDLREDVPVPDGGPFECGQRADLHGVPRGTADQTGYALMVRE